MSDDVVYTPVVGLPSADALTGAEWLYLVQGGNDRKADLDAIRAYINAAGFSELRLPAGGEATLASDDHALQIGDTAGVNLIFDNGAVQARNNGAASPLQLNENGAEVEFGGNIIQELDSPVVYVRDSSAADIQGLIAKLRLEAGADGANGVGAELGLLSDADEHFTLTNFGANGAVKLGVNAGVQSYDFYENYADFGAAALREVADPAAGNEVGDRDYNDARYASKFHLSTLIQTPQENKNYFLSVHLPQNVTIDEVVVRTAAGTCDVELAVADGVSATVWGSVSAGTAETIENSHTPVDGDAGEEIRIQTTSVSAAEDLTVDVLGVYRA